MRLAYGNYGMPHTALPEAVRQVAAIGYDALELCVAPGYPSAPDQLAPAARQALKRSLADHGLPITSLLIAKVPVFESDPVQHRQNLDYLNRVLELRADLDLEVEISSTLGGRADQWPARRDAVAACVADWAATAASANAVFAFEPHVGGLIDTPEKALWLLESVENPHLRVNFDYSHFELLGIPPADAIRQLAPFAAGVHVKDVRGNAGDFRFLLPGEGALNYADYLTLLQAAGYDGAVTVEISGQIFNAPDYDPISAAEQSYRALAVAFENAGIKRSRPR